MINVYKILERTTVEGPGTRFCIWTQGCKKHCLGCFATQTWAFGVGDDYSIEDLYQRIKLQKNIEGVTFLGGEPFEQAQELAKLAAAIRKIGLSVVSFTGYTFEELKSKNNESINALLKNTDLLIDGGFKKEKFDISRPWVGSSNQRYIFLTNFYNEKDIASYKNKIEMRISQDGKLEINGMGDFKTIERNYCSELGKSILK